jgi:predicted lipoprotein with Yx(FWY)xxD motif
MRRNRRIGLLPAIAALPLTALAISACGSSGSGGTASVALPKTASGQPATVGVASVNGLGKILVDAHGHTLYLFRKDAGTTSACSGECAAAWPPLRATGRPAAGTSVAVAKLGTTPRADGKPQVTYNGHPLYLYTADQKPGETNGQGLNAFGAPWFALSAAGTVVSATGSNPNSANGY